MMNSVIDPDDVPSDVEMARDIVVSWDCFGHDSIFIINEELFRRMMGKRVYFDAGKSKVLRRQDFHVFEGFSEKSIAEMNHNIGDDIRGYHPLHLLEETDNDSDYV
ncbi:hypothetical protein ErPhphiEa104_gp086 [Erwinia phage phiEa104]|uniref:Tail tape measure protein n=5 Tax=Caudoviricetes TaxID=2731619 RepID=A0A6B9RGK8_9CAUD|nr:hypothetical protein ErPhphiEa104_gp086 [Erwinia phage phiEa104]QHI00632.1 tail tape measure protein [Salmonella phage vB_SenM_SB18]CBX44429.1 hypothetical protein P104_00860 [Erwinia phage phiEa104]